MCVHVVPAEPETGDRRLADSVQQRAEALGPNAAHQHRAHGNEPIATQNREHSHVSVSAEPVPEHKGPIVAHDAERLRVGMTHRHGDEIAVVRMPPDRLLRPWLWKRVHRRDRAER
eukprot:Amastigsp_a677664_46.p4 type:complete len:116 gc:universal Amastigsp_a677664_46:1410-1063(-)